MTVTSLATSRIQRAVDKAYAFYPYQFDGVIEFGDWRVGPTFIVHAPEYEGALTIRGREDVKAKLKSLLQEKPQTSLSVALSGHQKPSRPNGDPGGKCTGRMITPEFDGVLYELAWPLVALAKTVGVKTWKGGPLLFGYAEDGKLLLVCQPRWGCRT